MSPFLSVIVPVYKVENKISRCIDSILGQSFPDFELILIDDGSPDGSGLICDEYAAKDSRILVLHQKNSGVSAARNLGIKKSSGKWMTFVDSDDYVEKNFLKNLVGKNELLDSDLVNTGDKLLEEKTGRILSKCSFPSRLVDLKSKDSIVLLDKLGVFSFGVVYCHLFNTSIVKKNQIHFQESLCLHEDHLFYFDYLKYVQRIWLRSETQYCYMIDFSVKSLSKAKKQPDELFVAYKALRKSFLNFLSSVNFVCCFGKLVNLNNFLIRIQLRAIRTCYENFIPKTKRMKYLKQYSRKDVVRFYRPKSLSGKIQLVLLLVSPRSVVDSIFRIMARLIHA